jgi:fatty-acyl-CoA synthase
MALDPHKAISTAETEGLDLVDVTIGDLLDQQARKFADHEALVYRYPELGIDRRITYREYRDEANRLAKALMAIGVKHGDHVAIWAPNLPEWPLLQMATAKVGAVLVTVNTTYRASEVEYLLKQGDVSMLFTVEQHRDNNLLESIYRIAPELSEVQNPIEHELASANLPVLKRVVLIGAATRPGLVKYADLLALADTVSNDELDARQRTVVPQDLAQMQYTSGTTGFPKGVQMTHHGMVNNARLSFIRLGIAPDDRFVVPMPFFHVAGSLCALLGALTQGSTLIPLISFDPLKQLELMSAERATFSVGVPTMLIAMVNHPRLREFDLSTLRQIGTGGSPVPVSLVEQVAREMDTDVWIIYGMTETHCTITLSRPEDPIELKRSTVGTGLSHVSIKIAHPRNGEPVGYGERGELCVRGFLLMKGYYNMPEKTAETIDAEGWLHSGDLATMNKDGYVNISGRVKEMVIRGGENIFPAEIEAFLMRHPKVAEAQIVGVPDPFMGEEVVALLRLKTGESAEEEEIREYCRANISRQKTPKYIRFVEAFPLTASGKVKKFELREQLIRELDLESAASEKTA